MAILEKFLAQVVKDVDMRLDELIPASGVEPKLLHEAIRWSVFAGGKRIRPVVMCAVGNIFGVPSEQLIATASAVEMIHTYSLIHDDLPAMDDDDLRRGRPTCHIQFGEATAILAGDVLQTLAFKTIAEDDSLSADIRIALVALIADASGTPYGMVSGQQLDLEGEGAVLSIKQIAEIHRQKTGALINASALAGAMIGRARPDEVEAISQYATNLGLLFQITDDIIDVTQNTETLGKTAGKDIASAKSTYPAHLGLDRTIEMADTTRIAANAALDRLEKDTDLLRQIADYICQRTK